MTFTTPVVFVVAMFGSVATGLPTLSPSAQTAPFSAASGATIYLVAETAKPEAVGVIVTPDNAASKGVSDHARVLPLHVYEAQNAGTKTRAPKDHQPAWTDDRLNPHRAEQNLAGHRAMRKIWTRTVPMRLID